MTQVTSKYYHQYIHALKQCDGSYKDFDKEKLDASREVYFKNLSQPTDYDHGVLHGSDRYRREKSNHPVSRVREAKKREQFYASRQGTFVNVGYKTIPKREISAWFDEYGNRHSKTVPEEKRPILHNVNRTCKKGYKTVYIKREPVTVDVDKVYEKARQEFYKMKRKLNQIE